MFLKTIGLSETQGFPKLHILENYRFLKTIGFSETQGFSKLHILEYSRFLKTLGFSETQGFWKLQVNFPANRKKTSYFPWPIRKRIDFYLPNGKTISFILIVLQIHILVELLQVREDLPAIVGISHRSDDNLLIQKNAKNAVARLIHLESICSKKLTPVKI